MAAEEEEAGMFLGGTGGGVALDEAGAPIPPAVALPLMLLEGATEGDEGGGRERCLAAGREGGDGVLDEEVAGPGPPTVRETGWWQVEGASSENRVTTVSCGRLRRTLTGTEDFSGSQCKPPLVQPPKPSPSFTTFIRVCHPTGFSPSGNVAATDDVG